jgi:hypothetical protein
MDRRLESTLFSFIILIAAGLLAFECTRTLFLQRTTEVASEDNTGYVADDCNTDCAQEADLIAKDILERRSN